MEQQKAEHAIAMRCRVLDVSASGTYAGRRRPPSRRAQQDRDLMARIRAIHAASRGTYGAPRVWAELRMAYGISCSRQRVARLMRQMGLQGAHRRTSRGPTRREPRRAVFPDRVQRVFAADAPDRLWVADLTQHPTDEGWLYLAIVLDAFSRRVVGWAMGERPTADLVIDALNMAVWNQRPRGELAHHSDQGAQYTSLAFSRRLEASGILGPMGSVGDALDNAVAESFFATLQTELLDRRPWPTRQVLKTAIFEYVKGFYNRHRRHSALGYLSPDEFERRWYLHHEVPVTAA